MTREEAIDSALKRHRETGNDYYIITIDHEDGREWSRVSECYLDTYEFEAFDGKVEGLVTVGGHLEMYDGQE